MSPISLQGSLKKHGSTTKNSSFVHYKQRTSNVFFFFFFFSTSRPQLFQQVDISVRKGTHQSENAVNKQLNDKERVAAALENAHLLEVVNQCLATATSGGVVAGAGKGPANTK